MLKCYRCGSSKISTLVWADANTNKYVSEGPSNGDQSNWCDNCKQHVEFINKK